MHFILQNIIRHFTWLAPQFFSKMNVVMYNGIADKIRFQYIKQRVPRSITKHNLDENNQKIWKDQTNSWRRVLVICVHIGAKACVDSVL